MALPSARTAVPLSMLMLLLLAPAGWASPHAGHGGGSSAPVAYGGVTPAIACHSDWASCTASGASSTVTGDISAAAAVVRTTPGTSLDQIDQLGWEGSQVSVPAHARSVTATVVVTGISLGDAGASSADGGAIAVEWIGASITDTGCATFGCGASTATSYSAVRLVGNLLGQTTKDTSDPTATRTFTVTVSMPDGSYLPAGNIAAAGVVQSSVQLQPLSCADQTAAPATCDTGTPHTGSAHAGISARVAQVSFVVS